MKFESRTTLLLILVALGVTCIFTKLSIGYLPSYDDGYYAQKARGMLATGDWLTPRIAERLRFDNPPGFMWLIALSYKIFGVDEFAARFPSALTGLLGILGTFFLFELLISTRVGFLAGVILTLTTVYLKYARHAMMDVSCAASAAWASYFFVKGLRGRPHWLLLAGVIGSYLPFAKSLFGAAPPAIFLCYLLATREWTAFKRWQLWAALALYLAPYGGWCLYEWAKYGREFLEAHFVMLMFNMSTQGTANDHHYDYVLVLLKYFPVFLPFMLGGAWIALKAKGDAVKAHYFGLIYFLVWFVMLSAQNTTKTWYFISAFPGCAGLAAVGLDRLLKRFTLEQVSRFTAGLTFVAFLIIQMTPVMLSNERAVDTKRLSPYVRAAAEQGFTLRSYETDYYGLNSSLLFYSDHDAPWVNEAGLDDLLSKTIKLAVIFDTSQWERLASRFSNLRPIRISTKLTLVASAPLAQERIF